MTDAVRCPICKREIRADAQAPRPFCSARCRVVDLGGWLDGRYRIGSAADEVEDEASPGSEEDGRKGDS
jgi:hypothetical protein